MTAPLIAIIGRPNVGKSTLFNRLAGRWHSIVEDRPGITRDRIYAEADILGNPVRLMDTGGLELKNESLMQKKMSAQAMIGIEEADALVFILDGRAGITSLDEEWIAKVRKMRKPKLFIVNKIDEPHLDSRVAEFENMGLKPLISVSAETQRGFSGLSESLLRLVNLKPKDEISEIPEDGENVVLATNAPLRVAIVGRPNVGKSTLLNALLGEERSIVDDTPGTTRDAIHTELEKDGQKYCFVDTAGIRRRAKTKERVEKFSVVGSLKMIDEAQLVLLILNGEDGPTEQDAHVAGYAFEKARPIVVLVNKWDEGTKKFTREEFAEKLELKMNYLKHCPVLYISAKTKKNLEKIYAAILQVRDQAIKKIGTAELNRAFERIITHHALPMHAGRVIKMYYATQTGKFPPSFTVFCNQPDHVHVTYKRYLINSLREIFDLPYVPIRIHFKGK